MYISMYFYFYECFFFPMCVDGRGGGWGGGVTRWVPQRETPLPTKSREILDSKIWVEVIQDVSCWLCTVQTIVREDRLDSNQRFQFFVIWVSKLSVGTASEECMIFFFKSQFLSMTKCWVYLIPTGTNTLCKIWQPQSRKSLISLFY